MLQRSASIFSLLIACVCAPTARADEWNLNDDTTRTSAVTWFTNVAAGPNSVPAAMQWDELRVGNSWSAVTQAGPPANDQIVKCNVARRWAISIRVLECLRFHWNGFRLDESRRLVTRRLGDTNRRGAVPIHRL